MAGSGMLLRGGRVLDPASGTDMVADVLVRDGVIDRVGAVEPDAAPDATVVDVSGLAVAPGFIDMHSHAFTLAGQRLQALDGVTTALELEAGTWAVADAYARMAAVGAPINYGFSMSWAAARMAVVADLGVSAAGGVLRHLGDPRWQAPASPAQVDTILERLAAGLAEGALGIGLLLGYAPDIDPGEYLAVAALAARCGVPTFTHARELVEVAPQAPVDGADEIAQAAVDTGARMHYCHVNSTSRRHVDRVLARIEAARAAGGVVTTEAYPYGAGSTAIGAQFLHPDLLPARGMTPSSIRYMPTGERVADAARLLHLRATDPGGLAIIDFLDEDDPSDRELLHRPLLFPDSIVASDAMPMTWSGRPAEDAWPVPAGATTHPRTAGTFARSLRVLTRERDVPLLEAVRRMTLLPALALEPATAAMARKGRLAAGCDADITVFDPATVTDQATYADSTRPSTGITHVLVNGMFVVRDGQLELEARPGRAIRG